MNRFQIRDILNAHKEHFRVLPIGAMNDILGIIEVVNEDEVNAANAILRAAKEVQEKLDPEKKKPAKKKKKRK